MISVLTITYQRHHLLEEAIESFLRQDQSFNFEMVVINDSPDVEYTIDSNRVRIINCKERFPSIAAKLEFGYKQCKYDNIYRLDDDDLIGPDGLWLMMKAIIENPGFEIYRSRGHYFYVNNKYEKVSDNINNGNCYTRAYLDRIVWPHKSGDEDSEITFGNNASIYTLSKPTMIYRWGMDTLHISGMGILPSEEVLRRTDEVLFGEEGVIHLSPHFEQSYYASIRKPYAWHR